MEKNVPATIGAQRPAEPGPPSSPWSFGAVVALAFVAIACAAVWYSASRPHAELAGWYDGLDAARTAAGNGSAKGATNVTEPKPMLLLYTADWCGACQQFKRDVLTVPSVADRLGRDFVRVKMDVTSENSPNAQMARKHGIDGIPTLVVLDPDGAEVDRLVGGLPQQQFLTWIQTVKAKMRKGAPRSSAAQAVR